MKQFYFKNTFENNNLFWLSVIANLDIGVKHSLLKTIKVIQFLKDSYLLNLWNTIILQS